MDTINLQYFYGLGVAIGQVRILAGSSEKLNGGAWQIAVPSALEWTRSLVADKIMVLPKTKAAAAKLADVLDGFSKLLREDRDTTVDESTLLEDAITAFYNVLEHEVPDLHCYVVTPVGAYEVSALLKNASAHLSELTQAVLPPHIRSDFNKVGECLALDLYTACGFHAMRAVEAQARDYHEDVTKVRLADVPLGTLNLRR